MYCTCERHIIIPRTCLHDYRLLCELTAVARSHQLSLVYRNKSMTFLWFFLQNHRCFFFKRQKKTIFSCDPLFRCKVKKKKKGGRWCVTHPPHRPRPPLLPSSPSCWNLPISQWLGGYGSITLMI